MFLQKKRGYFLNNFYRSCESPVTLQLPSGCCVVLWTIGSEKQATNTFCANLPKKERGSMYGNTTWHCPKKEKNLLIWKSHVTRIKKDAYISNELQLQNHSLTFCHQKQITSFSYQHSILFTHCLQHYCFLGQDNMYRLCELRQMSRQIWTIFLVQNDANYLDKKIKVFKKIATKSSDWSKILQWESQISTTLWDWRISWSIQQKTF